MGHVLIRMSYGRSGGSYLEGPQNKRLRCRKKSDRLKGERKSADERRGILAKTFAGKYAAIRMNSSEESHMQWTSEQPHTGHSLCWHIRLEHQRSSDIHALITASVQTVYLLLSNNVLTDHILCRCILYGCWLPHSPRNILSLFQRSG